MEVSPTVKRQTARAHRLGENRNGENPAKRRSGGTCSPEMYSSVAVKRSRKRKLMRRPYLELTQVPLGEKPKACWTNLGEGIRQISPVPSV